MTKNEINREEALELVNEPLEWIMEIEQGRNIAEMILTFAPLSTVKVVNVVRTASIAPNHHFIKLWLTNMIYYQNKQLLTLQGRTMRKGF